MRKAFGLTGAKFVLVAAPSFATDGRTLTDDFVTGHVIDTWGDFCNTELPDFAAMDGRQPRRACLNGTWAA